MGRYGIVKNKTVKRVNKRQYKKQYKIYMYNKALIQGYPRKGLKKFISVLYHNQDSIIEMKEYLEKKLNYELS
jgi:hypothetical protein